MDWFLVLGATDWLKEKVLGVRQDFDLIILGFKLIILLFIVSFVRNRFGSGPVITILTLIIGYILLFQAWWFFGPVMFIYLFIIFGFSMILFDLAISAPWTWKKHSKEEMEQMGEQGHAMQRRRMMEKGVR